MAEPASALSMPAIAVMAKVRVPRSFWDHSRSKPASIPIPMAIASLMEMSDGKKGDDGCVSISSGSEHLPYLFQIRRFVELDAFQRRIDVAREPDQHGTCTDLNEVANTRLRDGANGFRPTNRIRDLVI